MSICRRLDGLPLAIELAAARLRSLSLSDLHDRLDQQFGLLTGGSRTALARQQTLQATVEWSYSLLNSAEQLLLRRLTVFAETFDLDAAETVCGFGDISPADVIGLLGSLVDKSLVVADPAGSALRYRLLETIRQFATEKLAESGENEAAVVAAAHCAHYVSVAEAAASHLTGPDQGNWLARLDADQANLRRAARHAVGRPEGTSLVLRLGVALDRYWRARNRAAEGIELLVPALRRPDADTDPALFGAALLSAARAGAFIDVPTARRHAEQSVGLARQLGDDRLLSESLALLCALYYFAGESETGHPFGQESVERARRLGDDVPLGWSLMLYLMSIDPARSLPLYPEAFACAERSGDHLINFFLYNNAGCAAMEVGNLPAARAHLEAAARAGQRIGYQDPILMANLGWVLRAQGDPDSARSSFEACLRDGRRYGDNDCMATAILGLACLAGDAAEWYQAATLHGSAQAICDRAGTAWREPEASSCQDSLDQARDHLGDEQLKRAHAQGGALSLEKALDLALGKTSLS